MSGYRDDIAAFAARTVTTPEQRAAALARAAGKVGGAPPSRAWVWLAAAAVLLLGVGAGVVGMQLRPQRLERSLEAEGMTTLGDAVRTGWEGTGRVSGDRRNMEVDWDAGLLTVEVEPNRGVAFAVRTEEAEIRVVGTGFDVRRDAFGTSVHVRHGIVSVTCTGGSESRLTAGASLECPPTTPAALLARARAQDRRGDAADSILATLDAGLAVSSGDVRVEMRLLQASVLRRAGRGAEALTVVEAALGEGGGARRLELLRLAAALTMDAQGCEAARPFLDALATEGEVIPCGEGTP